MSVTRKAVLVCRAIACTLFFSAPVALAESLDWSNGATAVRITAITPNTFRISINIDGQPARAINTVFLDPKLEPGDFGKLAEGSAGHRELRIAAGTLELDPATGKVGLRSPQGDILVPPVVIADRMSADKPAVAVHIGWPQDRPFDIYACGNGAHHLVQHEVKTHVDNGIAVEPFFWAPAGFATFVVGSDDNAPGECDGKIDHNSVTWKVPGKSADLYLIVAPTLGEASRSLVRLTGRPPVPPRWAFGYMQSRWGWVDPAYIDDAVHQFQMRKLPVDVFIFDFEWYTKMPDYEVKFEGEHNFSDFNWNPALFPKPIEQIKKLHDAGIKFVGIRKPRLGNSESLKMIRSRNWDFRGGRLYDMRDLQFSNADLRAWYADQMSPLIRDGVDGWWDDEGEFTYTTYTYWNDSQRQALNAVRPNDRLWTINRAFQPGSSRWGAAAWTGDIHATWEDFRNTPTALLNWSIAGMPYSGCDIGGFHGETNSELLVRWMQAGTFFPVMRTHSELTVKPHFPWMWGEQAEAAIRKTLNLRYQFIPFLYSLGHLTSAGGEPIMRPLFMQYPNDPKVSDLSSEWLIGNDLLVAPVLAPGGRRSIYLPDDIWYDFASGERVTGNREFERDVPFDAMPLFVRGGSILPLAPVVQHTRDLPGGPLELNIYPGRDGRFTLSEDDGSSSDYLAGKVRRTTFIWNQATQTLSWMRSGPYDGRDCFRSLRVTLHDGTSRSPVEHELSAQGEVPIK